MARNVRSRNVPSRRAHQLSVEPQIDPPQCSPTLSPCVVVLVLPLWDHEEIRIRKRWAKTLDMPGFAELLFPHPEPRAAA
ncbi:uncharacterized protein SPSK_10181 [Sporothrix schenckii 1099-18]|uniref:Uncharacterized protein n=1 Tax=Sporothrix schenckii 1099-18 TaxID=1397361 RepID=A0A0F2M623_SPOSC|nr:uncharacterized protein SPSK_10181 [Sporothrix schenckii 1099-18]KJR84255.1 hypothetical protein SPSK_10181 [Sporothrix schenckii 1099-18]